MLLFSSSRFGLKKAFARTGFNCTSLVLSGFVQSLNPKEAHLKLSQALLLLGFCVPLISGSMQACKLNIKGFVNFIQYL